MTDNVQGRYADQAGRYRLDSMIATGGMGVVWRASDTRLDRQVAVKVLKAEYAHDPLFRTRFEGEARSAAALHHPGIAGVYDYGAGDDEHPPFLVMELVDGQPLSTLLAGARDSGRTLDTAVVQDLMAQAADALGVAHRAGIVHRDVKPANLLVTPDRQVKITDFGIARAADSVALTRTGSVMGTPQYLSPEQARGNPSTPASDVYSLGVVAFECLAGRRPFEAETPVATALAHLQQPVPQLPPGVPGPLAAVVRRALAKEPGERYADGAAFAAALRDPSVAAAAAAAGAPGDDEGTRVLTGVVPPVAAPVPPRTPAEPMHRLETPAAYAGDEPEEERRRSPWPVAIAVILLVIAAVAAAALLIGRGSDEPSTDGAATSPTTERSTRTAPTRPTGPTTPPSTPPSQPAIVRVDAKRYVCYADASTAVDELNAKGLVASRELDPRPNTGTCDEGTVSRLSREGSLREGDEIIVYYWGPPEPTTPPPSTAPTTPTETPTETPSDTGSPLIVPRGTE